MNSKTARFGLRIVLLVGCAFFLRSAAFAQTTTFSYQGKLTDGANAANGNYDLQFALFDSLAGGNQIGSTLTRVNTIVSGGIFTVQLDFGVTAFPGANRFLEIGVRPAGVGSFTILSPRQQINSTPYAIRTLNAGTADGLSSACVSCIQNSQINSVAGSKVNGTIPVASVPAGSANYIQNTESQQPSSNFNISGSGRVAGPFSAGSMSLPFGNMGIGLTTFNFARLSISDGAPWTTSNWKLAIGLENSSAIGWDSNGSGQALGIGRGFAGLHFFRANGGIGGITNPANTDMIISDTGSVGIGVILPARLLHVNGRARIGSIPLEASTASVCSNASGDLLQCGASSLRLKTNVTRFSSGLDIVRRLQPISFDWKDGSGHDIGLGAEEVAKAAPSFTFTDNKGEVTGVKYERLNILLINAVKEQQKQIERLTVRLRAVERNRRRRVSIR